MHKKYNLAGANNPNWQIAEPAILKTWARGILQASHSKLYAIHFMALVLSTLAFLGGFVLRSLATICILYIGYIIFNDFLKIVVTAVFPTISNNPYQVIEGAAWIHYLIGYMIIVKIMLFVLGKNLNEWIGDALLHLFAMMFGMAPLKLLAHGLLKENIWAQTLATKGFMGAYLVYTMAATPTEFEQLFEKINDLHDRSNDESARKELEELCSKHSKLQRNEEEEAWWVR